MDSKGVNLFGVVQYKLGASLSSGLCLGPFVKNVSRVDF
jgi:hypothetical protein